MNLSRTAFVASVATTTAWILKAVAIGVAGGLGKSPLEGPLFLFGLAAAVATALLTGMAFAAQRGTVGTIVGGVLGLVVASVFGAAEGALVAAVQPARPGWVWGEVNLWILMLALLVVSATLVVRRSAGSRSGRAAAHEPAEGAAIVTAGSGGGSGAPGHSATRPVRNG